MTTPDTLTLDYHGKPLRIVRKDGESWYVVADLCRILSIAMRDGKPAAYQAMRRLSSRDKSHHIVETPCGPRLVAIVNGDGLADLAFWAMRPDAPELLFFNVAQTAAPQALTVL